MVDRLLGILLLSASANNATVQFMKKGFRKIGFIDKPGDSINYSEIKWII